jgi:hypothetical protein
MAGPVSSAFPALMKMLSERRIGPSDVAVPVADVDRSTPLALDKSVLDWASRKLDGNDTEQENYTVPNHNHHEGIQNKLKVAHHTCREYRPSSPQSGTGIILRFASPRAAPRVNLNGV